MLRGPCWRYDEAVVSVLDRGKGRVAVMTSAVPTTWHRRRGSAVPHEPDQAFMSFWAHASILTVNKTAPFGVYFMGVQCF